MAKTCRRLHLPFGTRASLAGALNDLQCHVTAGVLVPDQPDGARPAASEWAKRPVAPEDQVGGAKSGGGLHGLSPLLLGVRSPPFAPQSDVIAAHAGKLRRLSAPRQVTTVIDRDRRDSEEIEFDFFDDAPTREASA